MKQPWILASSLIVALALPPGLLAAAVRSAAADRRDLTLTLYPRDLGLVQETRQIHIPAGTVQLELAGVAARMDAASVRLQVREGDGLRSLSQRLEHDLLSPERLLERYLGRSVQLVTRDDAGEHFTEATLLSLHGGRVFRVGDRIWVNHPGEVVLPELPGGLREHPALIWTLESAAPGTRSVELSYLTPGLGWSAHYVALLGPGGLSLTARVSLHNDAGVSFDGAVLRLVAGEVRRVTRPRSAPPGPVRALGARMEATTAEGGFREEAAFEYHVYDLERTIDLGEAETRQLLLRQADGVPYRRRVLFQGRPYGVRSAQREPGRSLKGEVELRFQNRAAGGLGGPLPAGTVQAYQAGPDGRSLFVGEDRMAATPDDGEVRLRLGRAFDVEMDRTQTEFTAVASGRYDRQVAFRIEVRNRKDEPAQVLLREPVPGDWKLLESSRDGRRADAGTLEFELTIPPRSTEVVTYRVAIDAG